MITKWNDTFGISWKGSGPTSKTEAQALEGWAQVSQSMNAELSYGGAALVVSTANRLSFLFPPKPNNKDLWGGRICGYDGAMVSEVVQISLYYYIIRHHSPNALSNLITKYSNFPPKWAPPRATEAMPDITGPIKMCPAHHGPGHSLTLTPQPPPWPLDQRLSRCFLP